MNRTPSRKWRKRTWTNSKVQHQLADSTGVAWNSTGRRWQNETWLPSPFRNWWQLMILLNGTRRVLAQTHLSRSGAPFAMPYKEDGSRITPPKSWEVINERIQNQILIQRQKETPSLTTSIILQADSTSGWRLAPEPEPENLSPSHGTIMTENPCG